MYEFWNSSTSAVSSDVSYGNLTTDRCLGSEFLIAKHFESPFGEGVGDLTYNDDGYLYATAKSLLKYGDRIYKIDPESGTYLDFFKHPSEPSNELKYITSCNGSIYVAPIWLYQWLVFMKR